MLTREIKCLFPLMSSSPSDSLYVIVSSPNISSSPEVVSSSGMVNGVPNIFVNTSLNRDRGSYSRK